MGEFMKRWVCVCALVVGGGCTDVVDSTGGEPVGVGFDGFSTADIATADCGSALDGAPCDDGNPCTLEDRCEQGLCVGATSNPCDSEGPCNPGNCDPVQGCVYSQVEDGTPCALGCFGSALCEQGSCVAVADSAVVCPEPDDPCVDQLQCESSTGECTREIYALAGTACNTDDNWCSLESCDGQGACLDDQETQTCSAQTAADQCW
ncbi:MAG: hypothetical protein VX938_06025, partial [Myxococcota bacterium]|nr:hypothetical protein [Myxococcota bacterium]